MSTSNHIETQVCFVNTEQLPAKTKHICYFTKDHGDKIGLYEVVQNFYPHPDAPEYAMVSVIVTNFIYKYHRQSISGSHAILLEAAQANSRYVTKKKSGE